MDEVLGDRYRIVEQIGAGAMGVVYRCLDPKLRRQVAVKMLHPGLVTDSEAREIVLNEAHALSSLNHHNVGIIYDLEVDRGRDLLVMEFVPGRNLEDLLKSRGKLSVGETLRLGAQLADGLAAAHEKDVVHRDVKPGNLRITPDSTLKILDFGIARLHDMPQAPTRQLVAPMTPTTNTYYGSMLAGSGPYMSPERLQGAPASPRSDIYAAGVVLYEMATGRSAFSGSSLLELQNEILNRRPLAPRRCSRRIPRGLERIILRAMDKDPARRYQTARALQADLVRLSAAHHPWRNAAVAAAAALGLAAVVRFSGDEILDRIQSRLSSERVHSLALLPFSGTPGSADSLATTLPGETTALLLGLESPEVLPTTGRLIGRSPEEPREAGRKLNADAVVTGSIVPTEGGYRLTTHIVETQSGRRLRGRTIEVRAGELSSMPSRLATVLLNEVHSNPERLAKPSPVRPAAYAAYLRGRRWLAQSEREGCVEAIREFSRAARLDSNWAPTYAALARSNYAVPTDLIPVDSAIAAARAAVGRALVLDPKLAEARIVDTCLQAYAALDIHKNGEQSWMDCGPAIEQALLVAPHDALAHRLHALVLVSRAEYGAAFEALHRANRLDPLFPHSQAGRLWPNFEAGRYAATIAAAESLLAEDNEAWDAWLILGEAYKRAGKKSQGQSACVEAYRRMRLFTVRNWLGCNHERRPERRTDLAQLLAPGSVFVADAGLADGKGGILHVDPATGAQTVVSFGGRFVQVVGVTLTPEGDLLVAEGMRGEILRVDPRTGEQTVLSRGHYLKTPCGMTCGPHGEVYVADWGYWDTGRIVRIDPRTGAQTLVTSGGPIGNALSVAVDTDGSLIVGDNVPVGSGAIYRVTLSGKQELIATGGEFGAIWGVAVDRGGRIYAADYEAFGGGGAIFEIDPKRGTRRVVSRGGYFVDPANLVILPDGDLLVADFATAGASGRLIRVDPETGEQTQVFESGKLVDPSGLWLVGGRAAQPRDHLRIEGPVALNAPSSFLDVEISTSGRLELRAPLVVRNRLTVAGTLVASAPVRVNGNCFVTAGGVLTHPIRWFEGLSLQVQDTLWVRDHGRIDLDGRGLYGGYTPATELSGETFDTAGRVVPGAASGGIAGGGGSHGGRGGNSETGGRSNNIYDDASQPARLGSGGAGAGPDGGLGGGRASIEAGECIVDGSIRANGVAGEWNQAGEVAGAGAGGALRMLLRGTLSGKGTIQATGGPGRCATACAGAGGGGRIAITCGTNRLSQTQCTAAGGEGGVPGSAGTVSIDSLHTTRTQSSAALVRRDRSRSRPRPLRKRSRLRRARKASRPETTPSKVTNRSTEAVDSSTAGHEALLAQYRAGDPTALDRLLRMILPWLWRYAHGKLPANDRDLLSTGDIVCLTLEKACRYLDRFVPQHRGSLEIFLHCILRSVVQDEIRRVRRRPTSESISEDHPDDNANPSLRVERRELVEKLRHLLDRLSAKERDVMLLALAGLNAIEIAAVLGIRSDATRRRRARALEHMIRMHAEDVLPAS